MIPAKPIEQVGILTNDKIEFPVFELDINPSSKHILHVDVGDLPPKEVYVYLKQLRRTFDGFFRPGTYMLIPCRNGLPVVQVYRLESDDEQT